MANDNSNLREARKTKNDEFFTQESDIIEECSYYIDYFKNKIIFCNCNDGANSNFLKYFSENFYRFKLKKLICTTYNKNERGYVSLFDGDDWLTKPLNGDGSYSSNECIEYLKECDIVVTNPPFSLFRDYVSLLMKYNKKFLIIGNLNAVTYMELFPYIMNNQMWFGNTCFYGGSTYFYGDADVFDKDKIFKDRYAYTKDNLLYWRVNGVRWFTNIDHDKRHRQLILNKVYKEDEYQKYDNFDAINIERVNNIPMDYDEVMGVPISFLDKYCPEQFEILGLMNGGRGNCLVNGNDGRPKFYVNDKVVYARILIRKK